MGMREEKYVAFCDTETQAFARGVKQYYPYIIGCLLCEMKNGKLVELEYRDFELSEDFIRYISPKDCIAYFHNGGRFDMLFFKKWITRSEVLFINSRIAEYTVGRARFRDSFLLVPIALKQYEKMTFDYTMLRNYRTFQRNKAAVKKYLESDCRNLRGIMEHFFGVFGIKLTIASACLEFWRRKFRVLKKDFKTKSERYDDIFRGFYYGGRCEVFKSGVTQGRILCYDINSAYPYAMLRQHPWRFEYADVTGDEIRGPDFVTFRGTCEGAFPYRDPKTKALSFPRDGKVREYRVTGWEYIAARDCGVIDGEVTRVLRHLHTRDFGGYVEHFYKMKRESGRGSGDYIVSKIALNSLYGKFAQDPRKYREHAIVTIDGGEDFRDAYEINGNEYAVVEIIDGNTLLCERKNPGDTYYNVAVSASITGFVRAYLYRVMHGSTGVVYCDTDSIFCRRISADATIHDTELGAFKLEATVDEIRVFGKKLYAAYRKGELVKFANKGARLNAGQFEELARNGSVFWESDVPTFHAKSGGCDYLSRMITPTADVNVRRV